MKFMEKETVNPTFTQKQGAKEFDCSDSTSKKYRMIKIRIAHTIKKPKKKKDSHFSLLNSTSLKGGTSTKNENGEMMEKVFDENVKNFFIKIGPSDSNCIK